MYIFVLIFSFLCIAANASSFEGTNSPSISYRSNSGVKRISMNHFLVGCGISMNLLDQDNNVWLIDVPIINADIYLYGLALSPEAEAEYRKKNDAKIHFEISTIRMFDFSSILAGDCYLLQIYIKDISGKLSMPQKEKISAKFSEIGLADPFRKYDNTRQSNFTFLSKDSGSRSGSGSGSGSGSRSGSGSKHSRRSKLSKQVGQAQLFRKMSKRNAISLRSAIDKDEVTNSPLYNRFLRLIKKSLRFEKSFTFAGNSNLLIQVEIQKLKTSFLEFINLQQSSITVSGLKEASTSINHHLSIISPMTKPNRNTYKPYKGGKGAYHLK